MGKTKAVSETQTFRDLLAFCNFTAKQLDAYCTAVLVDAYEPQTDDALGIPGVHTIPEKGHTSGGLGVHDQRIYKVCEDMATEMGQFYADFTTRNTKRLWRIYEESKRICETCGRTFMGNDETECLGCRGKVDNPR